MAIEATAANSDVRLPAGRWVLVRHPDDAPKAAKLIHVRNATSEITMVYGALDGAALALMPGRDQWFYDAPKRMTFLP